MPELKCPGVQALRRSEPEGGPSGDGRSSQSYKGRSYRLLCIDLYRCSVTNGSRYTMVSLVRSDVAALENTKLQCSHRRRQVAYPVACGAPPVAFEPKQPTFTSAPARQKTLALRSHRSKNSNRTPEKGGSLQRVDWVIAACTRAAAAVRFSTPNLGYIRSRCLATVHGDCDRLGFLRWEPDDHLIVESQQDGSSRCRGRGATTRRTTESRSRGCPPMSLGLPPTSPGFPPATSRPRRSDSA